MVPITVFCLERIPLTMRTLLKTMMAPTHASVSLRVLFLFSLPSTAIYSEEDF